MKNLTVTTQKNQNSTNVRDIIFSCSLHSEYYFDAFKSTSDRVLVRENAALGFLEKKFTWVDLEAGDLFSEYNFELSDKTDTAHHIFVIKPNGSVKISSYYSESTYFTDREAHIAEWEAFKRLNNTVKIDISDIEHANIDSSEISQTEESLFIIERRKSKNGNHLINFRNVKNSKLDFTAYFTSKMQILEIADSEEFEWASEKWGSKVKYGLPKKARKLKAGDIKEEEKKGKKISSYFEEIVNALKEEHFSTVKVEQDALVTKEELDALIANKETDENCYVALSSKRIRNSVYELYHDYENDRKLYGYIYAPVFEGMYLKIYIHE